MSSFLYELVDGKETLLQAARRILTTAEKEKRQVVVLYPMKDSMSYSQRVLVRVTGAQKHGMEWVGAEFADGGSGYLDRTTGVRAPLPPRIVTGALA